MPADDPDLRILRYKLGIAYADADQYDKAVPLFLLGWQNDVKFFGEDHPYSHMFLLGYANTLNALKRFDEAHSLFLDLVEHTDTDNNQDSVTLLRSFQGFAVIAEDKGESDKAKEYLARAMALEPK
jgi:tetratricopeptide (TPR) repeat protein